MQNEKKDLIKEKMEQWINQTMNEADKEIRADERQKIISKIKSKIEELKTVGFDGEDTEDIRENKSIRNRFFVKQLQQLLKEVEKK